MIHRNFTYIHINLHIYSVMPSPVLVLPLREQDKEKKRGLVHLPICVHEFSLLSCVSRLAAEYQTTAGQGVSN